MQHARSDYAHIQDASTAVALAQLVMSMSMATHSGLTARNLARQVLDEANIHGDQTAIVTNGTVRSIPADEPVFLIRGQDVVGANAVRAWADLAERAGAKPDIVGIARDHADRMDAWAAKKVPDLAGGAPTAAPADTRNPLHRIDRPEGRYEPAMFQDIEEANDRELKLIAKSHGYDLRLKVGEWDGEAADIIENHGSFGDALEAMAPPATDKDGYRLVGAWDCEDGDLVLAYVRPLIRASKTEEQGNG